MLPATDIGGGGHPALSDVTPCRWGGLFFSENQLVHCTNCNKNRGGPQKKCALTANFLH